jgi:hypothetical protein
VTRPSLFFHIMPLTLFLQRTNTICPASDSTNGDLFEPFEFIRSLEFELHFLMILQGKTANDLKAWDAAIERAKANLAHQMLRNTNADLQLRHASNAHKVCSHMHHSQLQVDSAWI